LALLIALQILSPWGVSGDESRGRQFIGFSRFSAFERQAGRCPGEMVLTSPVVQAGLLANQLIVSWNVDCPSNGFLRAEARALHADAPTKWYEMGSWSADTNQYPRESVTRQKDEAGDVSTDTLILKEPARKFQVRFILGGAGRPAPTLKFVGLALADTKRTLEPLPARRMAWGRALPVPERTQMAYPHGEVLCSPTTVSMLMGYWAQKLKRPELDEGVPRIVEAIYDAKWQGTGNWVFNMAYAGSHRGMRAYVTRLSDVSEIERWISAGVPVGLSLCYNRLRAKGTEPSGHLVVCVGFTPQGDPILNDPGTSKQVRKVFPRANLVDAWKYSENTVYLVYPEGHEIPSDPFGHWDSWTARKRALRE
jgi:hypothetical protein